MDRIDPGVLKISDGTVEIDLLDLCFVEWRPNVLTIKGSATELDSPYSQGRQLVQAQFDDVTDLFAFNPKDENSDDLIEAIQDVRRLLEKARNYWLTKWQDIPVHIIARGQCETNTRYAQITNFLTPEDGNPYASPFNDDHIFENWNLSITHRPWQEIQPGQTVCAEAYAGKCYCIYNLEGAASAPTNVTIPSNALVDDLSAADWTYEGWIYKGASEAYTIADKTEWEITTDANDNLEVLINYNITDATAVSVDGVIPLNEWVHIAMVFDLTTGTPRLYVNGSEVNYSSQTAAAGVLVSDVGQSLLFISVDGSFVGWQKLSNVELYSGDFTPPIRCFLPFIDTSTIGLWIYEGTGATADNAEGTAAIDGTINGMTWNQSCCDGADSYFGGGFNRCNSVLNFEALNGYINILDDASIQNLPNGDFTIDGWVYREATGAGGLVGGIYMTKNSTAEWFVNFEDLGNGYSRARFRAGYAVVNLEYRATNSTPNLLKHNQWIHVAFVYDSATKTVQIFIDGTEISYSTSTAGNGAYNGDIGNALRISFPSTNNWFGKLGWQRLSGIKMFTSNFTPPDRCSLPAVSGNTIGLWIYDGQGTVAHNHPDTTGGSAIDGSIVFATWEKLSGSCCQDFGTCEKENYFSLFSTTNQITHVFYHDVSAGTWSSNMQEDDYWPRDLYPDTMLDDILYIGADTSRIDTGVFGNVIFDFLDDEAPRGAVYEYWNGAAWAAIPNIKTDDMFTEGVHGIFFQIPSAWATTAVNGVTGYWIRIRETSGLILSPPKQQNRRVYTVTWPWVNLDYQAVPGDISAIARALIYGEGRDENETTGIPGFQRLVMALRSDSRGTAFNPYINISDVQQPCGVGITKQGTGTWTSDIVNAPTGRYLSDTSVATGWKSMFEIIFYNNLALAYYGDFRVYLLAKTSIANIQYRMILSESTNTITTDPVTVIDTGVIEIVDLGKISIPFSDDIKNGEILSQFAIEVQANIQNIGDVTEYYYVALMPSDEYIIDTSNFDFTSAVRENYPLDIDSIVYPKRIIRTWQKDETDTDSEFQISYQNDSVGSFFLQNNSNQRLFFFGGVPGTDNWNQCLAVNAIQLFRNARYHSMRGSR